MVKISYFAVKAQPQIIGQWSTNAFWEKFMQAKKAVKNVYWKAIGKAVSESQTEEATQLSHAISRPRRFQRLLFGYRPAFQGYVRIQQQIVSRSRAWSNGTGTFGRDFLWRRLRTGHLVGFATLFLVHEERTNEEGLLRKRIEVYEKLCENIQEIFSPDDGKNQNAPNFTDLGTKISDYKLGECIAVGSNGAVYEAEVCKDSSNLSKSASKNVKEQQPKKVESKRKQKVAIKLIFNFDSSNSGVIYRQTRAELVTCGRGAISGLDRHWQNGSRAKMKSLPSHCNIIGVQRAIVDRVPDHPEFAKMHPALLPYPDGFGRSSAMFLVMKRYESTLQDHLKKNLAQSTRYILALQLLYGISHLERNNIAHRDLKSNNILIEHDSTNLPRLVISDFGCAFVSEASDDMTFPFLSSKYDIRNGTPAIQPPEISTCQSGPDMVFDYTKADAWAAGLLLCEIMGIEEHLVDVESRNEKTELCFITRLIRMLLNRDPAKRISCSEASRMLHIELFGPKFETEFSQQTVPTASRSELTVCDWLLLHASETFAYRTTMWGKNSVVCELFTNFFSTLSHSALSSAFISWKTMSI